MRTQQSARSINRHRVNLLARFQELMVPGIVLRHPKGSVIHLTTHMVSELYLTLYLIRYGLDQRNNGCVTKYIISLSLSSYFIITENTSHTRLIVLEQSNSRHLFYSRFHLFESNSYQSFSVWFET